jgi:hypothetical protein
MVKGSRLGSPLPLVLGCVVASVCLPVGVWSLGCVSPVVWLPGLPGEGPPGDADLMAPLAACRCSP